MDESDFQKLLEILCDNKEAAVSKEEVERAFQSHLQRMQALRIKENNIPMIGNYMKVSWRHQLKNKTFSFINIFGLAAAMTVCLLIGLMFSDQKEQDAFQVNKNRIFRVLTASHDFKNPYATTPYPLTQELKMSDPLIETVTHLKRGVGGDAVYQNHSAEMRGYFADPEFFNVFSYELAHGNPDNALKEPASIIISSEIAKKLFGHEFPIGKTVHFNDRGLNFLDQGEAPVMKSWGLL